MSAAERARLAAWDASDEGQAADAAWVAAEDAKTPAPVHDRESPANHPEIPGSCSLCVKECTGACES